MWDENSIGGSGDVPPGARIFQTAAEFNHYV
jgi:hypothetical protein